MLNCSFQHLSPLAIVRQICSTAAATRAGVSNSWPAGWIRHALATTTPGLAKGKKNHDKSHDVTRV